jgi:hypothetical protein
LGLPKKLDLDLCGIFAPERKKVVLNAISDWIAQRGNALHENGLAAHQTHLHKAAAKGARPTHAHDFGLLTRHKHL